MSNIYRKQGVNTGDGGGSNTNFVGTRAEWEALSSAQQNAFGTVDIVGEDISDNLISKNYQITTIQNNDAPLGNYISVNIQSDVELYGKPISAFGTDSRDYPAIVSLFYYTKSSEWFLRVSTKTAGTLSYCRVIFSKALNEI